MNFRNPTRRYWTDRHVLYRCYDAEGGLLYIGATSDIWMRVRDHRRVAPWFPNVARIRLTVHPTRRDAFAAEVLAVREEEPLMNVRYTPREIRRTA